MSSSDVVAPAASTAVESRPARRPKRKSPRGAALNFWIFVGPFLIGLLIFGYVPIVWSGVLSFFDAQGTVTPTDFVGVRNYTDLFHDHAFTSSLVTFSLFALFIIPTTFILSLGLALLVNRAKFMQTFFRSVFFIPTACSYVVASLVWKMSIFNGLSYGLVNTILGKFGHSPISWLTVVHPPWYWLPLVTVRLWLQLGFYMILFLAGLQRIPADLYEAAEVDGAKRGWQTFRYITLPQLRPTAIAVLILNLIAAYQAFDEFYNLVGNVNYARPPLMYLYYTSLGAAQDYGHGSAGALIIALIIAVVTIGQSKIFGWGRAGD